MIVIKNLKTLRKKVTKKWLFDCDQVETDEIADKLINAMWDNSGLGLSANQIGIDFRIFAMRGDTKKTSIVCFNPLIKDFSPDMNTMEEGCLSLPDVYARVVRPAHVAISYQNRDGKEDGQLASGLTARVFQHELDHLDGILFVDRLGELSKMRALEKSRKLKKFRSRGKPVKSKMTL